MGRRVPDGFLWGSATAAHQVEGRNDNSDWWEWELMPGTPCAEPSGDACDHYRRYPEDITMLAGLGFNAYRFSVEWARVEPAEGEISKEALDHYLDMCRVCRDAGIAPVVTFHHFTSPRWIAADGSWGNDKVVERFTRYCERVAAHLGDEIEVACTINEPNIVAMFGYLVGLFPPGHHDPDARRKATENFLAAHTGAVAAIKQHCSGPVGMTLALSEYQAVGGPEADAKLQELRAPMEDVFLEAAAGDDFVGVQMYSRTRVGPQGEVGPEEGAELTQMGYYDYYPQALEHTIRRAAQVTGSPVIVTENGIATADDARRIDYVTTALGCVRRCLEDGIDLRGYFYWSLLDNFEWALGYAPTFGLVAVDRTTQERTIKSSARWLGDLARRGELP